MILAAAILGPTMTRRELFAAGMGAAAMAVVFLGLQQVRRGAPSAEPPAASSDARLANATAAAASAPALDRDDEAWRTANANLVETVRLTQQRLDRNEDEKRSLEKELLVAKAKLEAADGDGAPARNEFDLTQDDWKELAKTGTVKAKYPCRFDPEWHLGRSQAAALGLSPGEAATVETAYMNEEDRIASAIQPGCAKILGNPELARKLGAYVCSAVISQSVKNTQADQQLVADIRAGNVPMPAADKLDPFAAMLLAQSMSTQALQTDLARTFGPEEAKRLAFAPELGSCSGSWGGEPPRR